RSGLRIAGISSGSATSASRTAATAVAVAFAPNSQQATSATPAMATQVARRMRWWAANRPVRTTNRNGTTMLICAPGTIRYGMDVGTTAGRWQLYPLWERALRAIAAQGPLPQWGCAYY